MSTRISSSWAKAAIVVIAIAATACGSASTAALGPAEAATTLGRNLELTDQQTTCMREQFERVPSAAAVLDTDEAPADEDQDAFLAAIRTCVPPEAFGTTLAATVREELPDATDAQATCVHDNVVGLAGPEQDRLYLYFSNPATLDVADVGPAGADLLASCDLGSAVADPPTPDVTGDPTPTTATVAPG